MPYPPTVYEVCGRVLLSVARCGLHFRSIADSLVSSTPPGGGLVLEWEDGPFADDVADELMRRGDGIDSAHRFGSVVREPTGCNPDPRRWVFLVVEGVTVQLRARSPIGAALDDELAERADGR